MRRKDGRWRLYDAFCGIGGAAKGYQDEGFWVIGVDHKPKPDYCGDEFVKADALKWMRDNRRKFDAVHASPPCQNYSALTLGNRGKGLYDAHVDLVPPTRHMLMRTEKPWVMENVPLAPMRVDLELCGLMFGLNLFRHRIFELHGFTVPQPEHIPHGDRRVQGYRHGVFHEGEIMGVYGSGGGKGDLAKWQAAMGIDWTTSWNGLSESIPPAYTRLIARGLREALEKKYRSRT